MKKISGALSDRIFMVIVYGICIFMFVIVLYPLLYILSASISDPQYVNTGKMWLLPKGITFEGYRAVFKNNEIFIGYRNTIFYTLFGTIINLLATIPSAYALSRKDLVGRNVIMKLMIFTMYFSGGMIPSYMLMTNLRLINTVWSLLLPGAVSVYNLIIARSFFVGNNLKELEDAACIDGCNIFILFYKIVVPLAKPIIAVLALYYGVSHWNSYFSAMLYISNRKIMPLQIILREILIITQMNLQMMDSETYSAMQEQALVAGLIKYSVMIVSTLPIIMIYPLIQRFFVKGVMIGAVKG